MIRASAALVRKVAPGAVERIKRAIEPAPPVAPPLEPPPPHEWLASDIIWALADDPTVDMDLAVGLAAVCHKPRREQRGNG